MKPLISSVALAGLIMIGLSIQAQDKNTPDTKQIPKKVMDGLKAKFPKPEIDKWAKEKEGEIFIYDFEFKQGGQKFEADIKEDGTIHNWEKAITIRDLPTAVRMTIDKMYPKARLQEIMQITAMKDSKDELEGYEIVLITNDKKDVEVTVAPDGKILEDSTDTK
jgi:hypothetical protein